jgi:sensor c-di-GMP phosphodiesterase-like protein
MSRLRVIIGGTALALLAAAVPIAVMAYATWDRAVSVEQQRLRDIADRTLRRSDLSYQEALAALKSAEAGAYVRAGPSTSGACRRW